MYDGRTTTKNPAKRPGKTQNETIVSVKCTTLSRWGGETSPRSELLIITQLDMVAATMIIARAITTIIRQTKGKPRRKESNLSIIINQLKIHLKEY